MNEVLRKYNIGVKRHCVNPLAPYHYNTQHLDCEYCNPKKMKKYQYKIHVPEIDIEVIAISVEEMAKMVKTYAEEIRVSVIKNKMSYDIKKLVLKYEEELNQDEKSS